MPDSGLASTGAAPVPYLIRSCSGEDEPALLELVRGAFGEPPGGQKTTAFWRWKHVENPFGPSYALCAIDAPTGTIAALRVLMRWTLRAPDGAIRRPVRAVDTATHPDHQRRGLFSELTRFAIQDLANQGVPFVFNTPNRNSLPGYLKMGWQVVARWPVYVRPVRWRNTIRHLVGKSASVPYDIDLTAAGAGLLHWKVFHKRYGPAVKEVVEAHEQGRRQVGYRTERTLDYLDWRYGAHPHLEYHVHALASEGGLEGFLILRPALGASGLQALLITELFVRRPSVLSVARLLRSLVCQRSCDYLSGYAAAGTFERKAFFQTGFLPAPGRGSTFAARPLNAVSPDPTRRRSWDLTLGELEIF
ncbi:MAG TPA: GNAT family N-acetyltransferase [Chloroflexota bacterium]|nr:GNAT family N-acetyltransferase [Chloroflexota bacterium]